jgi:hypothetical protein
LSTETATIAHPLDLNQEIAFPGVTSLTHQFPTDILWKNAYKAQINAINQI